MNIGDKVRLLHGTEAGVIRAIKNEIIEVEIEDGFIIPVHKNEVVLISAEESKSFSLQEKNTKVLVKEVIALKGIFLAFLPLNDHKLALYCLNNTDWSLLFAIHKEQNDGKFITVAKAIVEPQSCFKVEEVSINQLEMWGSYFWQVLCTSVRPFSLPNLFQKRQRFRANQFKALQDLPLLGRKGYLFQIDKDVPDEGVFVQKIAESIGSQSQSIFECNKELSQVGNIVDLHIEKICSNYIHFTPTEILHFQIETFEKCLDSAIANGLSEITFIHGVGNGKLRYEIHKRISKHPQVAYYKDAQKEKFGYGATYIKLK